MGGEAGGLLSSMDTCPWGVCRNQGLELARVCIHSREREQEPLGQPTPCRSAAAWLLAHRPFSVSNLNVFLIRLSL